MFWCELQQEYVMLVSSKQHDIAIDHVKTEKEKGKIIRKINVTSSKKEVGRRLKGKCKEPLFLNMQNIVSILKIGEKPLYYYNIVKYIFLVGF